MANHPNRKKSAKTSAASQAAQHHDHEHDYSALLIGVTTSFAAVTGERLFVTDADGLNDLYLDLLPSERQVHNCSACRHFIKRYGALVAIGADGALVPAMWNPNAVPEFYRPAFAAMHDRVKRSRIVSVLMTNKPAWGTPVTGNWRHMAVTPPASILYRRSALTAGQAMAAARENFRTVAAALTEFTPAMLDEALRLLRADALARSEKFVGPVAWLRGLHDRPKGRAGENLMWRAVAAAPEGYCHPKASMIGPLLADIAAGMPFDDIKARFDAKMHPLLYQRPQVAPAAGNIAAAEAVVAKMGIAPSLERRFARLDELKLIWRPATPREAPQHGPGVFAHLQPKESAGAVRPVDMPAVTMTWDKFVRTILPSAEQMEIVVPAHGRFIALTTAVNAEAPPILKWDREDERNPSAWYVYPGGSSAQQWGLAPGPAGITGIAPLPTLWGSKPMPFVSEGVVLVIAGAVDSRDNCGNALFPECLRDDLHGIRATVEAYSRRASLAGRAEASACGYDIRKGAADCTLRVMASGAWTGYHIDRWD